MWLSWEIKEHFKIFCNGFKRKFKEFIHNRFCSVETKWTSGGWLRVLNGYKTYQRVQITKRNWTIRILVFYGTKRDIAFLHFTKTSNRQI